MKALNVRQKHPRSRHQQFSLKAFSIYVSGLLFIVVTLGVIKLPSKYYFDSTSILNIANGSRSSYGDKSYQAIADTLVFFRLNESPRVVSTLSLLLFYYGCIRFVSSNSPSVKTQLLLVSSVPFTLFIGTVYFGQFSKEIIPLALNIVLLLSITRSNSKKNSFLLVLFFLVLYGLYFRQYWLITAVVFSFFELMSKSKIRGKTKAFLLITFSLISILVVGFYRFNDIGSIQLELNQNRAGSEFAVSALTNYPSYLPEVLYWPYRLFSLFLPFLLVSTLTFQTIFFGVFFSMTFYFLLKNYKPASTTDYLFSMLFRYYCAHIVTLSLFEPDYGSFAKHLAPFFPILLLLLSRIQSESRK